MSPFAIVNNDEWDIVVNAWIFIYIVVIATMMGFWNVLFSIFGAASLMLMPWTLWSFNQIRHAAAMRKIVPFIALQLAIALWMCTLVECFVNAVPGANIRAAVLLVDIILQPLTVQLLVVRARLVRLNYDLNMSLVFNFGRFTGLIDRPGSAAANESKKPRKFVSARGSRIDKLASLWMQQKRRTAMSIRRMMFWKVAVLATVISVIIYVSLLSIMGFSSAFIEPMTSRWYWAPEELYIKMCLFIWRCIHWLALATQIQYLPTETRTRLSITCKTGIVPFSIELALMANPVSFESSLSRFASLIIVAWYGLAIFTSIVWPRTWLDSIQKKQDNVMKALRTADSSAEVRIQMSRDRRIRGSPVVAMSPARQIEDMPFTVPLVRVLDSTEGFNCFREFCLSEFSVESLVFWERVRDFKALHKQLKDIPVRHVTISQLLKEKLSLSSKIQIAAKTKKQNPQEEDSDQQPFPSSNEKSIRVVPAMFTSDSQNHLKGPRLSEAGLLRAESSISSKYENQLKEIKQMAVDIYRCFLSPTAHHPVNVSLVVLQKIRSRFNAEGNFSKRNAASGIEMGTPPSDFFDEAATEVLRLMERDTYNRFRRLPKFVELKVMLEAEDLLDAHIMAKSESSTTSKQTQ